MSTTQNTRFAEAYGCWVMTSSTNATNGAIPVEGAHRPNPSPLHVAVASPPGSGSQELTLGLLDPAR